jgi:hypothetical protein
MCDTCKSKRYILFVVKYSVVSYLGAFKFADCRQSSSSLGTSAEHAWCFVAKDDPMTVWLMDLNHLKFFWRHYEAAFTTGLFAK